MIRNNDGGAAFPRTGYAHESANLEPMERADLATDPQPGMSLRDYFAAKALNGIIANLRADLHKPLSDYSETLAGNAYILADAMLAARAATKAESK